MKSPDPDSIAAQGYAAEIRSWLVGRVQRRRDVGDIRAVREQEVRGRALLWWVLEGKRYPWLEGTLAESWGAIDHHVQRLLGTYNPVWRTVDVPEGETDWLASAFSSLTSNRPRFVTRASRSGLGATEREALLGWLGWVHESWAQYTSAVGAPEGVEDDRPILQTERAAWDSRLLRRYAHIARRSRWPLLRNVVAESLRAVLELQEIDRLPLPTNHATLFELVCMVRILRALEPEPAHVRWLDLEHGGNRVDLPGLSYRFQESLGGEEVLATSVFDHGLREAVQRHAVRVPKFMDGLIVFDRPRAGFEGILVEAKSGTQSFDAAVYQLMCYRAALRHKLKGRLLVCGIVEVADDSVMQREALDTLPGQATKDGDSDLWVFSSADRIGELIRRVLGPELALAPSMVV